MKRRDGFRILVINPGSTSTKVAVYLDETPMFSESYSHSAQELSRFERILDQLDWRRGFVYKALDDHGFDLGSVSAVACRGGRLKPLASGTYLVNDRMLSDSRRGLQGEHASNLACIIGDEIARRVGVPAFVVDPVSVDELDDIARVTGVREIQRNSLSHALNMKAMARRAAKVLGMSYEDARLIVAHMGGGGSVSVHVDGRMVDLYNCDKEGPFAAERAGALPTLDLVNLCYSGRFSKEEVLRMLVGGGGLMSHLNTRDIREVEARIHSGDKHAEFVLRAMAYGFAKAIASFTATLGGKADAIVLTGGMAYSSRLVEWVKARISFIGPVLVFPGENELESLALGVLRVLRNDEPAKVYE